MKILLCSPIVSVGGIARWTRHIIDYYNQNKYDNIELSHYFVNGKSVYKNTFFLKRLYWGVCTYFPLCYGIRKKLKNGGFDIIHLCSSASISLLKDLVILRIAKKYQVRSIIHFRFGRIPQLYDIKNWEYKLIDKVIKRADKVIVIDQKSYNVLFSYGYRNLSLVPNPVAPEIQKIILNNQGIKRILNKIVFAGHVVPTKGVFELVKACKQISNITLRLVGAVSDDMKYQLQKLAGKNFENWLEIVGEKDFESTIKEYLSAGIFVLPTYTEGFPNVIIEGMACGCPIVTTPVGAIPEMLDIEHGEHCGICVPSQNVEKLKDAIVKMLNNREYALQCGKNAQERVNQCYSMPIVWNQLVDIWKETLTR